MDLHQQVNGYTPEQEQEDYDFNQRREDFILSMQKQGFDIVLPAANELQVDIDSDEHYAVFLRSSQCLARNWKAFAGEGVPPPVVEEHPSKSGLPRRHITIRLPFEIGNWQRIAMQAALGSDPLRELLSSVRLHRGDEHPTLFVESKQWSAKTPPVSRNADTPMNVRHAQWPWNQYKSTEA